MRGHSRVLEINMNTLFTTYFDKNYLQRGLTLIRSLFHHKPDAAITVLCLDKITYLFLAKLAIPHVTLLQLEEFEKQYPELHKVKNTRSIAEYCWTMTPCLILHLLNEQKEGDGVIYLDADQMFFSSPTPIVREMRHSSVLIQSHNFPARLREKLLKYGEYNVGVLGAKNDADGIKVISWWKERCLEWCSVTLDDKGRFGDQKYLESFSALSRQVAVIKHPGIGIAPWNHENVPCRRDAQGRLMYGKVPAVIYHFHSLAFISYDIIVPTKHNDSYRLTQEAIKEYYVPYLDEIDASLNILHGIEPDFSLGTSAVDIPQDVPFIVRTRSLQAADQIPSHTQCSISENFTLFMPGARPTNTSRNTIWEGDYSNWEEARRHAGSYGTEEILFKTLHASRMVRDGKAVCERDSVLLPERQYLLPTLSGILLGAARNGNELHIIDFGGSLGSAYRTHYPFLKHLKKIRWHVVELPAMAQLGRQEFQNGELFFHDSIEACLAQHRVDGILLGGVLQYLEDPYCLLYQLGRTTACDFLILDRTFFNIKSGDRICVQHVPEWIYRGSYPCRFLDLDKTLALISERFDIVDVIPALEGNARAFESRGIVAVTKAFK